MDRMVGAALLVLALSGCFGGSATLSEARQAVDASHASAHAGHEYLLFLGVTGTEGQLNWTRYEQVLLASSDPGASIAEAFDQDVENGLVGDGRLGSWLTTHFVFDGKRNLLGGLYTQYTPEHGIRTVHAPFRGPYTGTLALPSLQLDLPLRADEPVLCTLTSSLAAWRIDSQAAARTAMSRPLMQQHVEAHPDGEVTYYYLPRLGVEEGCEGSLDVPSNHWIISHTDLDAYLDGGHPTVAEVRIDASTGEVLAESVRPLHVRAPVDVISSIAYQDVVVPAGQQVRSVPIEVGPEATRLSVDAVRVQAPRWEWGAQTRLVDPDGDVVGSKTFGPPVHTYRVPLPAPGTYRLEYVHDPLEPEGVHEVSVHARVLFG